MRQNEFLTKVVNITPGAMYDGKIIDQYVDVELKNGTTLKFFDYACRVEKRMKGKKIKLSITIQTAGKPIKTKNANYETSQKFIRGRIVRLTSKLDGKEKLYSGVIDTKETKISFIYTNSSDLKKGDIVEYSNKDGFSFIITEATS